MAELPEKKLEKQALEDSVDPTVTNRMWSTVSAATPRANPSAATAAGEACPGCGHSPFRGGEFCPKCGYFGG